MFRPSKYVERRETRLAGDAIPQVHSKPDIAGPQRVAAAAELRARLAALRDCRHGERAGALETGGIVGAPLELEERISIAAGAMAKVRTLGERPCRPDEFAAFEQKFV